MDTETNHMHVLSDEAQKQANADKRSAERREWYKKAAKVFKGKDELTIKELAEQLAVKYDFAYQLVNEMSEMEDLRKLPAAPKGEGKGRPSPLYTLTERGVTYLLGEEVIGDSSQQISRPEVDVFFDGTAESTQPPTDTPEAPEWT